MDECDFIPFDNEEVVLEERYPFYHCENENRHWNTIFFYKALLKKGGQKWQNLYIYECLEDFWESISEGAYKPQFLALLTTIRTYTKIDINKIRDCNGKFALIYAVERYDRDPYLLHKFLELGFNPFFRCKDSRFFDYNSTCLEWAITWKCHGALQCISRCWFDSIIGSLLKTEILVSGNLRKHCNFGLLQVFKLLYCSNDIKMLELVLGKKDCFDLKYYLRQYPSWNPIELEKSFNFVNELYGKMDIRLWLSLTIIVVNWFDGIELDAVQGSFNALYNRFHEVLSRFLSLQGMCRREIGLPSMFTLPDKKIAFGPSKIRIKYK